MEESRTREGGEGDLMGTTICASCDGLCPTSASTAIGPQAVSREPPPRTHRAGDVVVVAFRTRDRPSKASEIEHKKGKEA